MIKYNLQEETDYVLIGLTNEQAINTNDLFEGNQGDYLLIPSFHKSEASTVYVGLGKRSEITRRSIKNAYAKVLHDLAPGDGCRIDVDRSGYETLGKTYYPYALEGLLLADYHFKGYKQIQNHAERVFHVWAENPEEMEALKAVANLVSAINDARTLTLEPQNKLDPKELAKRVMAFGQVNGYDVAVHEEEALNTMGLRAFLSVSQGSQRSPRLIVMKYLPLPNERPVGIVGKGITCDTGGYCLKKADSLPYVKGDMAGAANVIGLMNALASNGCQCNVVGVIAACENVLDGNSYKPGDIIESLAGKTIEVVNTDAEGRLTLADALTYIQSLCDLEAVVDIATLTGATGVCFGNLYTPVTGNDTSLIEAFMNSAEIAGEDYWQLPIDQRYGDQIISDIADLKNGGKPSTITAAMFLQAFIEEVPWMHLDIASTAAQYPMVDAYSKDVPTGIGIPTLYHWLNNRRSYHA